MAEININELELYFETFGVSDEDLEIMKGVYILSADANHFVTSTIQALRMHPGNQNYRNYYDNLVKYYELTKKMRL